MPLSAATRKATLFRETSPSETLTGVRFCAAPGVGSDVGPGPIAAHAEQASTMASDIQTLRRARRKRELRMHSVPSSCDADPYRRCRKDDEVRRLAALAQGGSALGAGSDQCGLSERSRRYGATCSPSQD